MMPQIFLVHLSACLCNFTSKSQLRAHSKVHLRLLRTAGSKSNAPNAARLNSVVLFRSANEARAEVVKSTTAAYLRRRTRALWELARSINTAAGISLLVMNFGATSSDSSGSCGKCSRSE